MPAPPKVMLSTEQAIQVLVPGIGQAGERVHCIELGMLQLHQRLPLSTSTRLRQMMSLFGIFALVLLR